MLESAHGMLTDRHMDAVRKFWPLSTPICGVSSHRCSARRKPGSTHRDHVIMYHVSGAEPDLDARERSGVKPIPSFVPPGTSC